MGKPFEGIRVLEVAAWTFVPAAGAVMADLGADVIKVEGPGGDPYRAYQSGQFSPHFQAYNRNKRSIALDLRAPADHAIFDQLVREADVYIQNFRPGAAERIGAGPRRLAELNPKLVYCSISGFGVGVSVSVAMSCSLGARAASLRRPRRRPRWLRQSRCRRRCVYPTG